MPINNPLNAEARSQRNARRQEDATKAMKEAATEARRVEDNTLRLRALRLAKEAADAAALAAAPPKPAKGKKAAAKKKAPAKAKSIKVEELNAEDDG